MWWSDTGAPANQNAEDGVATELNEEPEGMPAERGKPVLGGEKVEVYEGISVAAMSTVFDVSGRGLTGSLKAEVRLLTELKTLDLSDNAFTGLPAEVGQLQQLEVLDLSNNQFTGLPHELADLDQLERLDIRGNAISEFDLTIIRRGLPASVQIVQ